MIISSFHGPLTNGWTSIKEQGAKMT